MRAFVRRHPVVSFFAAAYAISWSVWVPMALGDARVDFGSRASHVPGLLGPMIAALLVTAVKDGRAGLRDLVARMRRARVGGLWIALAVGSPFALFAIAAAASAAAGSDWPTLADLGVFGGLPAMGPIGAWLLLVLVNGYGEETGWRGFALPELSRRHSPLAATFIIALLWAGWHTPTFFILESYRGLSVAGTLPGFVLGIFLGAVVLTWLYNRTGSVLLLAVWHGGFNLVTATRAARGDIAAIVSTLIMVWGIVLVVLELRARRRGTTVLGVRELDQRPAAVNSPDGLGQEGRGVEHHELGSRQVGRQA